MFAQSKGGNYSLTNGANGVADAIDFDGATDYLSRSSDLAGNADGKTFTFSAWVWRNSATQLQIYNANSTSSRFWMVVNSSDQIQIIGRNTGGTIILNATIAATPPIQTFFHVLVSCDLSNSANRAIYINDVVATVTWTTYTNANIDFTETNHRVGTTSSTDSGRLAHVFLDYTYRDLSVEANRRIFVLP